MADYSFNNVLNNQYKNPYSMYDPQYVSNLEQKVKMLESQHQQMSDPLYAQYLNLPNVQTDKMNSFVTCLFMEYGSVWEKSPAGQQFKQKHDINSENFKNYKNSIQKATPNQNINPNQNVNFVNSNPVNMNNQNGI